MRFRLLVTDIFDSFSLLADWWLPWRFLFFFSEWDLNELNTLGNPASNREREREERDRRTVIIHLDSEHVPLCRLWCMGLWSNAGCLIISIRSDGPFSLSLSPSNPCKDTHTCDTVENKILLQRWRLLRRRAARSYQSHYKHDGQARASELLIHTVTKEWQCHQLFLGYYNRIILGNHGFDPHTRNNNETSFINISLKKWIYIQIA